MNDMTTNHLDFDSFNGFDFRNTPPPSPSGDSGINSDPDERSKSANEYSTTSPTTMTTTKTKETDYKIREFYITANDENDGSDFNIIDLFAGVRIANSGNEDCGETIRSHKGTIRGIKNRVRAGVATFLPEGRRAKDCSEKESGKVVVYLTTLGVIRETWSRCFEVRKILRTLMVKTEERDVFMSRDNQIELMERMELNYVPLPQVFVEGQYFGDADTIVRLNESGVLRQLLRFYKSNTLCTVCQKCGGFRMLPCTLCNGSKKSVHRNHFTEKFVALRCTNCDDSGLIKCNYC